jgi:adhesin transport system membrane fusion protein
MSHPAQPQTPLGEFKPPNRSRAVLSVSMLALVGAVIWAAYGTIDQVTRTQGQIIAAERTQIIQARDGGVLTNLHTKEGDKVKAGQLLATFQKERAQAAVSDTSAKVAALRITLARLQAEIFEKPLQFDPSLKSYTSYIQNQTELYNKRQRALRDEIESLTKILALSEDELKINRQLEASGDVSRAEILRLERSNADIAAQLSAKRNKYLQDAQAEMTKTQEELSTQIEQLKDRNNLLEHTELLAPIDGVVNNIKVSTLGGVVRQGETVMELLPDSNNLIVETKVVPGDIGFVKIGQTASVKLDAYDYSIYGAMRGVVSYISPDVLSEETRQGPMTYYRVRVMITGAEFKGDKANEIQVRPGLTASVEIKAKERSVLSYLIKPLSKTLSMSMWEK